MKSVMYAAVVLVCTALLVSAGCTGNDPDEKDRNSPEIPIPTATMDTPISPAATLAAVTTGAAIPQETASPFTCEFDENLLKASSEFSAWFNRSCYYNSYCGWWESVDMQPASASTLQCINCSIDGPAWAGVTPTYTPCPARTPEPAETTGTPTTAATSAGACGTGLSECRVFSTDYCVDLMTDLKHCGSCRHGCYLANAENGCSGGSCYIRSCNAGWADCNGRADDGCEVDIDSDDNNCGKCGRVCSLPNAGHAVCAGEDGDGICQVEWCASGWVNSNGLHEDGCEAIQ